MEDCPICCLPLPIYPIESIMMACCSKIICNGCNYANQMRELEGKLQESCPFCRHPAPKSQEEAVRNVMKRAGVNDPVAMRLVGCKRHEKGDYAGAFEYWTKAAGSGDTEAHLQLSLMYQEGKGVEKDKKKELHHLEEAAIGGHSFARHNLGCLEDANGRLERAWKHFIIAANQGVDGSLENLRNVYEMGYVSKEDFAAALRGHQAAVDATKSPQRDEAEAIRRIEDRPALSL
jgi:hypothetical protein